MERSDNTLMANDLRNDQDTILASTTFSDDTTMKEEGTVVHRTSRSISRRKLSIFVSVAVAIGVIILVILIPVLGLRKNA